MAVIESPEVVHEQRISTLSRSRFAPDAIITGLIGLIMLVARSRAGELFFGAVLGIAGLVGAVQVESFRKSLALGSGMGWLAVAAGTVIVVAALLLPRTSRSSTTVTQN